MKVEIPHADRRGEPSFRKPLLACPPQLGDLVLALPAVSRLNALYGANFIVAIEERLAEILGLLSPGPRCLLLDHGRPVEPETTCDHVELDGALLLGRHAELKKWLLKRPLDPARILTLDYGSPETGTHLAREFLVFADRMSGLSAGEEGLRPPHLKTAGGCEGISEPYIVVHPGNSSAQRKGPFWRFRKVRHRAWPRSHWVDLIPLLGAGFSGRIVLTGWGREEELAKEIAQRVKGPVRNRIDIRAGRTSVGELAALLARARLYVGVDTGPSHLAAALGTPSVVLFGPTDPTRVGPLPARDNLTVLRIGIECSPCNREVRRRCPLNRCLLEMGPSLVAAAALRRIEDSSG